jgi:hypothetical protein
MKPGERSVEDRLDHEALYPCRNLETRFCGISFENPFVLAASPCTDELEILGRGLEAGWGSRARSRPSRNPGRPRQSMMTSLDHGPEKIGGDGQHRSIAPITST